MNQNNTINWMKIKHDTNGNPRYVCSWLEFGTETYAEAVKLANTIGGKKYHNKKFGGGIVFQSYNIHHETKLIQAFYEYNKAKSIIQPPNPDATEVRQVCTNGFKK